GSRHGGRGVRISGAAVLISACIHMVAGGAVVAFYRAHGGGPAALPEALDGPKVVSERPFLADAAAMPREARGRTFVEALALPKLPEAGPPASPMRADRPPSESLGTLSLIWEVDPGRPHVEGPRVPGIAPPGGGAAPGKQPGAGGAGENAGGGGAAGTGSGGIGGGISSLESASLGGAGHGGSSAGNSDEGLAGDGGPPIPRAGNRPPAYPLASRQRGEEGVVRLRFTIRRDGMVGEVEVVQSTGHAALDASAESAVREWTFEPSVVEKSAEQDLRFFIQR
ncbi:MAG TPA: energy transducer TonB, partial [Phycisphaerae bacterium]|nr:energy transducer TonB [Phycisphaerae bacterium]